MKHTALPLLFTATLCISTTLIAATVINVPGDQATIAAALAAASGATEESPVEIRIADGEYQQTATLAVPSYVTLRGNDADPSQVQIIGDNSASKFTVMTLAANATASGIWVRKGRYNLANMPGGVKVSGGTLTNSWVSECYVYYDGGGVLNDGGLVTHCRIFQNYRGAAKNGMGLRQWGANAVTEYCEICNNQCTGDNSTGINGAGAYVTGGLLSHCIITNNMSGPLQGQTTNNGGVYLSTATMEFCLVADNAAMSAGGVFIDHDNKSATPTVVRNCTIVGNRSRAPAGLIRSTTTQNNRKYRIENTIVWDNYATFAAADGEQDLSNIAVDKYLAVTGLCSRAGVGELAVSSDPVFIDPAKGDYRLAANSPCRGAGLDVDGNPCDLGYAPYGGAAAREVPTYAVRSAVFVSKTGSKTAPYDTMEKATDDILAALNYCGGGTVLTVDDGTYEIDREIELRHAMTMRSANGAAVTTLKHTGADGRVVKVAHEGAVLDGFTLTGGKFTSADSTKTAQHGALAAVSFGLITNCVALAGNTNNQQNSPSSGIANSNGTVADTVIANCSGGGGSGGAYYQEGADALIVGCVLTNNTQSHNSAYGTAAGLSAGLMDRCWIMANKVSGNSTAVGAHGVVLLGAATMRNTVVAENYSTNAKGEHVGIRVNAANAVIENCTIVSNRANAAAADGVVGGIAFSSGKATTVKNTVIFGNTCNNYAKDPTPCDYINYSAFVTAANNAVTKLEPSIAFGDSCLEVTNAPALFRNAAAGDYRLTSRSELRDKGTKIEWMEGAHDLAGNTRLFGLPDIGCYEYASFTTFLMVK